MPTFEFADCPTSLDLAATPDTREQVGSVRCTLRNTSSRKQGARIRVEPLGGAEARWFALADAPATAPLEIEQDIDAGGTLTVTAAVKVPGGASAGNQTFRLRVISETAPDTDFAEGPAISFNIAALAEPEVKRTPFPWWAVVVGLVMLLAVGGAVGYLLWPKDHGFDGRHVLLANAKTLKCLMIQDGNAGNNILAVQTTCKDEPLQTWVLKQMEPPKLQIRNAQTNKCLTIAGGVSTENNIDSLQYDCDSHPSRTWTLVNELNGTYQILNVQTGKCLTIAGGVSTDDGVRALQYNCDDDMSRRWTLTDARS